MIKIIAVGKLKEKFYEDAVAEYARRLLGFTKLNIIQVADEKCPENYSEKQAEKVRQEEGERILKNIKDNDCVVTLEIKGKRMDSVAFSSFIQRLETETRGDIVFVIGGSTGLSPSVSARANYKLSFSDMTFPHQLMRVILLEQIYRGYKIMHGQPYHK